MDRFDRYAHRFAVVVLVLAVAYFGAHVALAVGRGWPASQPEPPATCHEDEPCWDCATMGNRLCGPVTTADPWPECGPACHDPAAAADVQRIAAATGRVCWAEDNPEAPEGYEVLCR